MGSAIIAERLTKYYGRRPGVIDLTFEVEPGEIFGYLGPNGAGKTTTIRTLMDLIRPSRGRATVLGFDSHREGREVRRRTGYVPGEPVLDEHLTGEELLRYFASLRGDVIWSDVQDLRERLSADLTSRIGTLSLGNRQKIVLIQALMHRPELLLLDEPTAGLDPLMQRRFYEILKEVRAEGRTVFLSSHNLPEVERACDRVGIVRAGRLAAVEDVGTLQARALRQIELHFSAPVPAERFARLPGVREAHGQGDVVRLTVVGPLDPVVKAAAQYRVVNMTTREPSLEDVFLAFYTQGPPDAA